MPIKKIILTTIFITWLVIIFAFSHQNGAKSENTSDNLVETIIEKTNINMSKEELEDFIVDTRVIVRKSAHIILYFGLGVISYLSLRTFNVKRSIFLSIIITLTYAITDELHQLFIPNRNSSIIDVFIDLCGSVSGIFITHQILKLFKKKSNNSTK